MARMSVKKETGSQDRSLEEKTAATVEDMSGRRAKNLWMRTAWKNAGIITKTQEGQEEE